LADKALRRKLSLVERRGRKSVKRKLKPNRKNFFPGCAPPAWQCIGGDLFCSASDLSDRMGKKDKGEGQSDLRKFSAIQKKKKKAK